MIHFVPIDPATHAVCTIGNVTPTFMAYLFLMQSDELHQRKVLLFIIFR
jgi:hypothetical protein